MYEWSNLHWRYQFVHMCLRRRIHWNTLRDRCEFLIVKPQHISCNIEFILICPVSGSVLQWRCIQNQKNALKLDKVLIGEESIKSVWLMTFINECGHYEESLPNKNLPFWYMGWSLSSIRRLHLWIRWNWATRSYNEAYNGTYFFQSDSHIFNKTLNVVLVDINECSSSPCMNGATCTDAVNSYTCACVAGYTGTHCETGEKLGLSNL